MAKVAKNDQSDEKSPNLVTLIMGKPPPLSSKILQQSSRLISKYPFLLPQCEVIYSALTGFNRRNLPAVAGTK